jgi:hypothetical protein
MKTILYYNNSKFEIEFDGNAPFILPESTLHISVIINWYHYNLKLVEPYTYFTTPQTFFKPNSFYSITDVLMEFHNDSFQSFKINQVENDHIDCHDLIVIDEQFYGLNYTDRFSDVLFENELDRKLVAIKNQI